MKYPVPVASIQRIVDTGLLCDYLLNPGQLGTLLDDLARYRPDRSALLAALTEPMLRRLRNMRDTLKFIGDRGVALVKENEPLYFKSESNYLITQKRLLVFQNFVSISFKSFLLKIDHKYLAPWVDNKFHKESKIINSNIKTLTWNIFYWTHSNSVICFCRHFSAVPVMIFLFESLV